jgi:hypothetical protein
MHPRVDTLIRYKREQKVGGGTGGREINAIVPLDAADLYDATRRGDCFDN